MMRAHFTLLLILWTPACVFVDDRHAGTNPGMALEPLSSPSAPSTGERLRVLVPASLKSVVHEQTQDMNALLKMQKASVLQCWENVPPAQIKGTEKFVLEFGIDQQGQVVNPKITSDRLRPTAPLLNCLKAQVRVWKFPRRFERGMLLVTHTFRYTSGS